MPDQSSIPFHELLEAIYTAQDRSNAKRQAVCKPGCAVCCTDRVGLTSLEAAYLAQGLKELGRFDLLAKAAAQQTDPTARPAYTFNQLAQFCMQEQKPPSQQPLDQPAGICHLLEDDLCAAYAFRPLACRAMCSKQTCQPGGSAQAEDWWLTLDSALFQLVEHLSAGKDYGLLPDLLAVQVGRERPGLLTCKLLPGLPAPPQDQERLERNLGLLFAQPVEGKPLGLWFDNIRQQVER